MEKSIYTTAYLKKAIEDDIKGALFISDILVDVEEIEDQFKIGILIEGLSYSFNVKMDEINTALQVAISMLKSQLILYAISCLKDKHKTVLKEAVAPTITNTLLYQTAKEAQEQANEMVEIINQFDILKGTYYEKINKRARSSN